MENTVKKAETTNVTSSATSNAGGTGKLKIQSPWVITYKKIKALFERDTDLDISTIINLPDGNYAVSISSKNTAKLQAIEKILKPEFVFGNIKLLITFVYEENNLIGLNAYDFKTAFANNDVVKAVYEREDYTKTTTFAYVLFAKEVIQFYNDDLMDYYGNYNGLAQDIAKEIFKDSFINYGTAMTD